MLGVGRKDGPQLDSIERTPQLDLIEPGRRAEPEPTLRAEPEPGREAQPEPASETEPELARGADPEPAAPEIEAESEEDGSDVAYLGDRLLGGLADLSVQVIMLGLAVAATHWLGIVVSLADWKPFAVLVLVFSFLYWAVPLAFWGRTPGMAWVGHTARATSGEPLSFGQTFMRWLGSVLTLLAAGLPMLVALTGRSFTDRLSDSETIAD